MLKIAKIKNDKYYTPIALANHCWDKVLEVIGEQNISEIIEPSCGDGSFYHHYKMTPHFGYDIEPECNYTGVTKADFLQVPITYLYGRLIIGNPPYGRGNSLSMAFYKKSVQIADYIAFILPISQFNNNIQLYDFDLIYSEDLGEQNYSGVTLQCCFNIYKRPVSGELNKKPDYKLSDVKIVEYRRDGRQLNIPDGYDYAMGTFGAGCVGKTIHIQGQYALECYFYIKRPEIKEKVLKVLKNSDWKSVAKGISGTYRLPQWKILKYLKEQIPELE
ncbi:MAG: hypothetical protein II304_07930 [Bacteroidales bacterium]|nr:hypothetical protein [Bacteroidales bacterium]